MTDTKSEQTDNQDRTPRLMPEILSDLAILRNARAGIEAELDAVKAKETNLKAELLTGMINAGIVSGKGAGLIASVKKQKSYQVTDSDALTDALGRAGVLEDYTRLDARSAAKAGFEMQLPGVSLTETTYLSVSEVAS